MDSLRLRHHTVRHVLLVLLSFLLVLGGITAGSSADAKKRHRRAQRADRTNQCVAGPATDHDPCHEDFEICDNGIDDDLDGFTDGDDPDCPPPDVCADGLDNEEAVPDGRIDFEDPEECPSPEGPPGDPSCTDDLDNDNDGLTDGADPDCQFPAAPPAPAPPAPEEPPPPPPATPEEPEEPDPCASPTIVGTPGNDKIKGTKGNDVIDGLGGNDKIRAKRGNDIICGGPGNDKLRGGRGNDVLVDDGGRDKQRGGPGIDDLDGGPDFDKCRTGRGDDPTPKNCEVVPPPESLK